MEEVEVKVEKLKEKIKEEINIKDEDQMEIFKAKKEKVKVENNECSESDVKVKCRNNVKNEDVAINGPEI